MKKTYTIAFCGIDGSGKSTQLREVDKWLTDLGHNTMMTKVNFSALEVIYELSDRMYGDPFLYGNMPPLVVRLGIAYDVAHHYMKLSDELSGVDFLLYDRHTLCFKAYGKAYGVEDMEWVNNILSVVDEPDLILYFDGSPIISQQRINGRTEKPLRADELPDHLSDVKLCYEELIANHTNVIRVDASKGIDEIFEFIRCNLEKVIARDVNYITFPKL